MGSHSESKTEGENSGQLVMCGWCGQKFTRPDELPMYGSGGGYSPLCDECYEKHEDLVLKYV